MNTDRLIKYLKNDLSELTEIFNELEPGSKLSSLEIKMIINRIKSVNEDFQLLENEISQISTIEKTSKVNDTLQKEESKIEKKDTQKEPVPEDNTINVQESKAEEITIEEPQTKETENEIIEEPDKVAEISEEPEEQIEEEIENPQVEEVFEDETREEPLVEPQKTIADKYQGSSNSLNEQIANLIEQKDLASKLQQNPIDDLTKAIKLNDKIWYSNELFDGNLDLYRETIRTINKMNELDEALEFLESNFQFDQEKKSFKSFIEMIYRRFLK